MRTFFNSLAFPALMLAIGALSLVLVGSALGASPGLLQVAVAPTATPTPIPTPTPDLAATGKHLFVAKGCVVCHVNDRVADISDPDLRSIFGNIGPNLTNVTLSSEYLHRWLQDPQAIKPGTAMPNLHLSADEIDALVAFLTTK